MEDYEYLISLLIKWNSTLKLVALSVIRHKARFCHDEKRCYEFCDRLSTFLSKNLSLRQINMSLPFEVNRFMSCIDTIQSGLDQNSTLEDLTITSKNVIFQRNKHTSKLELVKGHKLLHSQSNQAAMNIEQDDANQPVAVTQCMEVSSVVPRLGSKCIQLSRDSKSLCIESDDGVDSCQASPAKRPRLENCSKES